VTAVPVCRHLSRARRRIAYDPIIERYRKSQIGLITANVGAAKSHRTGLHRVSAAGHSAAHIDRRRRARRHELRVETRDDALWLAHHAPESGAYVLLESLWTEARERSDWQPSPIAVASVPQSMAFLTFVASRRVERAPCDDEPGHRQQVPAFRCSGLDPGLRQAIEIAMLFSDPRR
jgi:hypothetical protein